MRQVAFVFGALSLLAVTPSERYVQAIAAMQSLPTPAYIAYRTDFRSPAAQLRVIAREGYAQLDVLIEGYPSQLALWSTYDGGETTVRAIDGSAAVGLSPLFNPTWGGIYDWIRYGLSGPPVEKPASASEPSLRTIAWVTALSPGGYAVEDAGEQPCPDGLAGRHLHLVPRTDPANHPLTDVTVDNRTSRFCSVRFSVDSRNDAFSIGGFIEVHFGSVSQYWLATDGTGVLRVRMFDRPVREAPVTFWYSDLAFDPAACSTTAVGGQLDAIVARIRSAIGASPPVLSRAGTNDLTPPIAMAQMELRAVARRLKGTPDLEEAVERTADASSVAELAGSLRAYAQARGRYADAGALSTTCTEATRAGAISTRSPS